jgi:hypothetical protein
MWGLGQPRQSCVGALNGLVEVDWYQLGALLAPCVVVLSCGTALQQQGRLPATAPRCCMGVHIQGEGTHTLSGGKQEGRHLRPRVSNANRSRDVPAVISDSP